MADGRWCAKGHSGRLCSQCVIGYYPSGSTCQICPTGLNLWIVAVAQALVSIFVLTFIALKVYRRVDQQASARPQVVGSALRVLTAHLQQLYFLFKSNNLVMPSSLSFYSVPSISGAFQFSSLLTSECFFPHSSRLLLGLLISLLFTFTILLILLACYVMASPSTYIAWRRTTVGVLVMSWSYCAVPLIGMALENLGCVDPRGTNVGEPNYLNSFPYQACDSNWRRTSLVPALALLSLWGVMVPLVFAWRLRYVSVRGLYADSTVVWTFGPLFERYKATVWWWEFIVILRGLAMACVISFISYWEQYWQPLAFFVIVQSSALAQSNVQPYVLAIDNTSDLVSLYLLLITFFSALLQLPNDSLYSWILLVLQIGYVCVMLCQVFHQDVRPRFARMPSVDGHSHFKEPASSDPSNPLSSYVHSDSHNFASKIVENADGFSGYTVDKSVSFNIPPQNGSLSAPGSPVSIRGYPTNDTTLR